MKSGSYCWPSPKRRVIALLHLLFVLPLRFSPSPLYACVVFHIPVLPNRAELLIGLVTPHIRSEFARGFRHTSAVDEAVLGKSLDAIGVFV
jgi:hypothetical protein